MEVMAIFAIIEKAISVISAGIAIGQSVAPAIDVIKNLITKQKTDSVSDTDLEAAEAVLDKLMANFNAPIN